MRIAIVGNGAVGLTMASYLAERHEVTVFGRRVPSARMMQLERLGIRPKRMRVWTRPVAELDEQQQDVIFVMTKSQDVAVASSSLSGDIPVYICANGIAHVDWARKKGFGLGVVEFGAMKDNEERVRHTGEGRVRLGGRALPEPIDSEIPIVFEENIDRVIVEKLFANAIINPITALCRVRNGLLREEPYIDIAKNIYDELRVLFEEDIPFDYVLSIVDRTAANESSMLRDVLAGRRTEVDAILTPLLERARMRKVDVPTLTLLQKLLRGVKGSC